MILNKEHDVYAIRTGAEVYLLGNIALYGGIEVSDYFYKGLQYACVTPRLLLPLTRNATPLLMVSYGYNINNFGPLAEFVGNHRVALTSNLCLRKHRMVNRIFK